MARKIYSLGFVDWSGEVQIERSNIYCVFIWSVFINNTKKISVEASVSMFFSIRLWNGSDGVMVFFYFILLLRLCMYMYLRKTRASEISDPHKNQKYVTDYSCTVWGQSSF